MMPMQRFRLPNRQIVAIREAQPRDAAAILSALNQIGGETDFLTFGGGELNYPVEAQENIIEAFAIRDNSVMMVAEIEGKVVAIATFDGAPRARLAHTGELGISILQAYWGLGIGRRMMDMLIDWAGRTGVIRKINLRVHEKNERAIELYEKIGFRQEGVISREYQIDGQFFANIWMGLAIDPADSTD